LEDASIPDSNSNYYWLLAISRNFRYNVPGSETGFQTDAENTTFYISPSV